MRQLHQGIMLLSLLLLVMVPVLAQDDDETESPVFDQKSAIVRIAHLVPDAPEVDIYLNDELALEELAFAEVTDWSFLDAGRYSVVILEAGSDPDDATPVARGTFNFVAGTQLTVTLVGTLEANSVAFGWFFEDYTTPIEDEDTVGVTVYHAIYDAPSVDVLADGDVLLEDVAYPTASNRLSGARYIEVPEGQYDLTLTVADDPDTEIFEASGIAFSTGTYYLIAAVGTPDEPDVIVVSTQTSG